MEKEIQYFFLENGTAPVRQWLDSLDTKSRVTIMAYIKRVALGGSKKNIKALQDKLFEIKLTLGPGYRIYYTEVGNAIILLLNGGSKRTQKQDIKKAKEYLEVYNAQKRS